MILSLLICLTSSQEIVLCFRNADELDACSSDAIVADSLFQIEDYLENSSFHAITIEVVSQRVSQMALNYSKFFENQSPSRTIHIIGKSPDAYIFLDNQNADPTAHGTIQFSNIHLECSKWNFSATRITLSAVTRDSTQHELIAETILMDSMSLPFFGRTESSSLKLDILSDLQAGSYVMNSSTIIFKPRGVSLNANLESESLFSLNENVRITLDSERIRKLQFNVENATLRLQSADPINYNIWIETAGSSEVVVDSVINTGTIIIGGRSGISLNEDFHGILYFSGKFVDNDFSRRFQLGRDNLTIKSLSIIPDSASLYDKNPISVRIGISGCKELRVGKVTSSVGANFEAESNTRIICNEIDVHRDVEMNSFVSFVCLETFTFESGVQRCTNTECVEIDYTFRRIEFVEQSQLIYKVPRKGLNGMIFGEILGCPNRSIYLTGNGPDMSFPNSNVGNTIILFKCDSFDFSDFELIFERQGSVLSILNRYVFQRTNDPHSISWYCAESADIALSKMCLHYGHPELCPREKYTRIMDVLENTFSDLISHTMRSPMVSQRLIVCAESMAIDLPDIISDATDPGYDQLPVFQGIRDGITITMDNLTEMPVQKIKIVNLKVEIGPTMDQITEIVIGQNATIEAPANFICNYLSYDAFDRNSTSVDHVTSQFYLQQRVLFTDPLTMMLSGSKGVTFTRGSQKLTFIPDSVTGLAISQSVTLGADDFTIDFDCEDPVPAGLSLAASKIRIKIPAQFESISSLQIPITANTLYIHTSSSYIPFAIDGAETVWLESGASSLQGPVVIPALTVSRTDIKIDNDIRNKTDGTCIPVVIRSSVCTGESSINRDSVIFDGPVIVNNLQLLENAHVAIGNKVSLGENIRIAKKALLRAMNEEFELGTTISIEYDVEANTSAISANQEAPYNLPDRVIVTPVNVNDGTANGTHPVIMFPSDDVALIDKWFSTITLNEIDHPDDWEIGMSVVHSVSPFISLDIKILQESSFLDMSVLLTIAIIIFAAAATFLAGTVLIFFIKKCRNRTIDNSVKIQDLDDDQDPNGITDDLL